MIKVLAEKVAVPLLLLVIWEACARTGLSPHYLSSPVEIAHAFAELIADGTFGEALAASLYRVALGFVIGAATGTVFGLLAGTNRYVADFLDPLVSFIYPVPKIAFLSIFLMLFGLGHGSKIAIIAASGFFVVFIAAETAVRDVNPRLVWSARNMGAGRWTVLFRVVLPASLPELMSGYRIALSLSYVLLFSAEVIGSREGLGHLITEGTDAVRFDMMFVGIVTFAILGFTSDRLLLAVRRRVLHGQLIGTEEQLA